MNRPVCFRFRLASAEFRFTLSWMLAACIVPLFMTPGCGGGGGGGGGGGSGGGGGDGDGSTAAFVVTISSSSGGVISPTSANVQSGSATSFSVTPAAGYSISSVSGCGGSLSGNTYTTGPITANCTMTASFGAISYAIGGEVTGLTGTIVLQNNGGADHSVTANGPFSFSTNVPAGSPYSVTILTQPTGQFCAVLNATGASTANVSDVAVTCVAKPLANEGYGSKRILVTHLKFADMLDDPFPINETEIRARMLATFFEEISYGASQQVYEITPWAQLPETRAYYQQLDPYGGGAFLSELVRYIGENYVLSQIDIVMIVLTPLDFGWPGCLQFRPNFQVSETNRRVPVVVVSGQGGQGVACNQNASIMSHEIGHAYGPSNEPLAGFLHTSAFTCKTWEHKVPTTLTDPTYNQLPCEVTENPAATFFPYTYYDFLGGYRGHPNVFWKSNAGWVDSQQLAGVHSRSTITIDPIEIPSNGFKGIHLPLGADQVGDDVAYWVEYRSKRPTDLENPAGVTPVGAPDKVKIWINLPNVPPEPIQGGRSLIGESKIYTFTDFSNGPSQTDLGVGETFLDPHRGIKISRGSNLNLAGITSARIDVEVSSLELYPPIGTVIEAGAIETVVLRNNGTEAVLQGPVILSGRDQFAFAIAADSCSGIALQPGSDCSISVAHNRPTGDEQKRFAAVEWTSDDSVRYSPSVGLIGVPGPL